MRVFKKIMYIVLAFVPILPLLLFAVCNVGNTNGVEIMPFGSFRVADLVNSGLGGFRQNTNGIVVQSDSILSHFLSGYISDSEYIEVHYNMEIMDGDIVQEELDLPAGYYDVYGVRDGLTNYEPRFIDRVLGVYDWFSSVGITPPSYIVYVFSYLAYMLFIHVSFMIFDIIVFVPKKISEMLGG